ncbi:MAG TPA: hypothetical protein VFN67_04945 [Polyangiales bacterium]|nr:hypothetical protein [Polyangiales bacterium]
MISVLVLVSAACASGLDGPSPSLSQRDPLAISPAIVCSEQASTTLDIRGQHFSPVPVNVPDGAGLLLPTLTLERSAPRDGSKSSATKLVYSGEPKAANALRWLSETHMQARLDRGRLQAGIYDARVVNPSGEQATAEAALTVVDRPVFAAQAESVLCDSRAEQELVIEGSGFLKIADALPALQITGRSDAFSITELTECVAFGAAELCSQARLSFTRQLPVGTYEAKLVNPAPAACQTEEALPIRVEAGVELDSNPIDSLCMRGQTRVLVVRGEGFQDVDGTLPSASLAGKPETVVALDDCEPATGPRRICKKLHLELPAGNLAPSEGATTLSVTNPAPASCSASATVQLRDLLQKDGAGVRTCLVR